MPLKIYSVRRKNKNKEKAPQLRGFFYSVIFTT